MMNHEALRDFARNAQTMIDAGAVEDRLRHYLSSKLSAIFPDLPWWIEAHMMGTEERVRFSSENGDRQGFVDAVVGKTAVEYEKNLTNRRIFDEGYYQVKEYCAALYNVGIPANEILGVLSDTVRWYGYSVSVLGEATESGLYGPDNIELQQVTFVDLSVDTAEERNRFEGFVDQFLGRDQSRLLNANTLVMDFGIESSFYRNHASVFENAVRTAMSEKPEYADLIRQVWQNFIAYLGISDYGDFSVDTYINEFYLVTVAKIICVNVLAGAPVVSARNEIQQILDGGYFLNQNIENLVDYDYFGWLNSAPYSSLIMDSVAEMQQRLVAYDFSRLGENDIFGKLLAQMANAEHRLMLGQEFTPHWAAREIVEYNMDRLTSNSPKVLDMCCGSGVFLIETIKAIRNRFAINEESYSAEKDAIAFTCVMGFDIDPLAVMLAKVNWVMAMRDLFSVHDGNIVIPIYHADSLFVATPITHRMPENAGDSYVLHFDNHQVELPGFLLSPEHRSTFDSFMAKAYRFAMIRANHPEVALADDEVSVVVDSITQETEIVFTDDERVALCTSAEQLILELERLQRQGRNGIWHFILSNSYRPGVTARQFDCIVSNPPWMAMSKLAVNPYKTSLQTLADRYGIKPTGASHPHMELATIFLVGAVDRYLKDGGFWSCIMPGSLLSGLNHEHFRSESFRTSRANVPMQMNALWELPIDTFKNKAVVISGKKENQPSPDRLYGRVYAAPCVFSECSYTLNRQGARSAWTNRGADVEVADVINDTPLRFCEGCDLFPRTVLFHNFVERANGNWDISPIERTSELWYLWSDSHKVCCNDLIASNIDKQYIFDALISKHLSPFVISPPAKVLLPGRKEAGEWTTISTTDRVRMNTSTNALFTQIETGVQENLAQYFDGKINIYGKLRNQNFSGANWLVLSNAGGSNPCAAYMSLETLDRRRLVVDQTLYWYLAETENEALFYVGLLNSEALSDAIKDFQPEGGFGPRHIHTLPYKIMPHYDPEQPLHTNVVESTRELIREWVEKCSSDATLGAKLNPNSGALHSRRRRQQSAIKALNAYESFAAACSEILR